MLKSIRVVLSHRVEEDSLLDSPQLARFMISFLWHWCWLFTEVVIFGRVAFDQLAEQWFRKAANNGSKDAIKALTNAHH